MRNTAAAFGKFERYAVGRVEIERNNLAACRFATCRCAVEWVEMPASANLPIPVALRKITKN